ncbi:glycosyltransferase family 2 protein [Salipiger abyssi]|uniref:glycosyltransferase family 2 protein n=1 Tax=Salipiger abyssi TaxID=1250539 RepID=UPI001A8FBE4A|nr:glycosyltransferase [Salipiger abyssi]MBN9886276.1 glycosyltransferase [Salipiger abyssi]
MSETETILIGVCTFRRSSLEATLRSLAEMAVPEGTGVRIVVADNDETPSARARTEAAANVLPVTIDYVHAPARNISIARNAILDHAAKLGCTKLAFIDDDETVDAGWLSALVARQRASGHSAVVGPVRAAYLPGAPDWMRRGAVHDTEPDVNDEGVAHTGYTCNLLLDLADPRLAGLRFELARGRSGGEDTAYFARYQAGGGRIAYAPDAVVREMVPEARASRGWLLQRRFRMGQTHGGLIRETAGPAARIRAAALAALKFGYCLVAAAAAPFDTLRRNRALIRGALHAGAVSGCLGGAALQLYGAGDGVVEETMGTR